VRATAPDPARTLVRLKLRLIVNRARGSTRSTVQLVVSIVLAVAVGLLGALVAGVLAVADDPIVSRTFAVVGATALTVGWAVVPLLSVGSDETLDPARLVLLPLRRATLMRGLLGASLVGPAPFAVIAVCAGAALGFVTAGGWLVLPAVVLLVVLSAVTARALSTTLAAGLSSRRGRDGMIIVASVFFLAVQGVRFVRWDAIGASGYTRIDDLLRWTPPGLLGQAAFDSRDGRPLAAMAEMVVAAAVIPLLLLWWARVLERSLTHVADGETRAARSGKPTELPLLIDALPFLARSPWGAVTAKELRYLGREPRRKVNLVNSVIIGVALPVWVALHSSGESRGRVVLLATLGAYVAVLGSSNQFGLDGAATWLDMVAGRTARTVLIGKNVAVAVVVLPIVVVVGTVVAALTGGWAYLPGAVGFAVAGVGAGVATGNVVSTRFPLRLSESRSPFAGAGAGQGCSTALILTLCLILQNVLLVPVLLAALASIALGPLSLVVAVPVAVAYGGLLWWGGLELATTYADDHQPELLALVSPARSA
jgi:ABC-2 type transport system permease protein